MMEPISCGTNGQRCIELREPHVCAFLYLLHIERQNWHFIGIRIGLSYGRGQG